MQFDLGQSTKNVSGACGLMAAFIYRCPNTRLRIQALAAEEITENEETYHPVTCVMCRRVHLVNPFTGKVLGEEQEDT